jgi:hypothetical protein
MNLPYSFGKFLDKCMGRRKREKSGSSVTNDQRRSCKHQGVYNYNLLTLLAAECLQGFGGEWPWEGNKKYRPRKLGGLGLGKVG